MLASDQSFLAFETRELTEAQYSLGSTSALQDYIDYIVSFPYVWKTRLSFCKVTSGETKGWIIASTRELKLR